MTTKNTSIFPGIHFPVDHIHPRVNPKFSVNLWRFAKRHAEMMKNNFPLEGFFSNIGSEYHLGYRYREVPPGGRKSVEEISSCRAMEVLVHGAKATLALWQHPLTDAPDFWETYLRIGRCMFDPDHNMPFIHAENRYDTRKNRRTCNWCGFRQKRVMHRVVVVKERWAEITAGAVLSAK